MLGIDSVETVLIYGQKTGSELPFWMIQVNLSPASTDLESNIIDREIGPDTKNKDPAKDKPGFVGWLGRQLLQQSNDTQTRSEEDAPQVSRPSTRMRALKDQDSHLGELTNFQDSRNQGQLKAVTGTE